MYRNRDFPTRILFFERKIDHAVFKNKIFKLEKTPIFKPRYYFVLLKF
jgi:hypothetical protein